VKPINRSCNFCKNCRYISTTSRIVYLF